MFRAALEVPGAGGDKGGIRYLPVSLLDNPLVESGEVSPLITFVIPGERQIFPMLPLHMAEDTVFLNNLGPNTDWHCPPVDRRPSGHEGPFHQPVFLLGRLQKFKSRGRFAVSQSFKLGVCPGMNDDMTDLMGEDSWKRSTMLVVGKSGKCSA